MRSKDVADALASELLPGVGPEAFEPIVGDLTLRALEAGEVLVEQGDPAHDAFVVLERGSRGGAHRRGQRAASRDARGGCRGG